MPRIVVRGPTYYSEYDEDAFFAWLQRIPAVRSVRGVGRDLVIEVRSRRMPNTSLHELIALFTRYKMSHRELAQFESAANSSWLREPGTYWQRSMFGVAGG